MEKKLRVMRMHTKVRTIRQLAPLCAKLRKNGKTIVTTNGVFDILHVGHVRYLEKAKSLGDILIVGLNSDDSVRKLKGRNRPVNGQKDRAEVLSALQCVDYVVIFGEQTPAKLLAAIKPSVHVKGGDYEQRGMPEAPVVEKFGGEIKIVSFVRGYSTTSTIRKIIEKHK